MPEPEPPAAATLLAIAPGAPPVQKRPPDIEPPTLIVPPVSVLTVTALEADV